MKDRPVVAVTRATAHPATADREPGPAADRHAPAARYADLRGDVHRLLALVGDPLAGLGPGDLVVVKPNMFQLRPGFCSHPDVVAAVAEAAAATGARVVVAERTRQLHHLLDGHEVHRFAEVRSLDDEPLRVTQIPAATSLRVPLAVPEILLECDFFIGVPQLRTHASVVFSNAMKNLVGLLPGFTTRIVHMAGVDESTVDLNLLRPQHLVVCDATTVIEGNYPMSGRARDAGLLAAASNATAADAVLSTMVGIDPREVAYLVDAARRGIGPIALDAIDLRGEPLAGLTFPIERAPASPVPPRDGIHVHVDRACAACRRYVAGALVALREELLSWPGEMTVLAGPQPEPPPGHGVLVLVGNCLYEQREAGIYIEGCPPRAIQLAAFRYAMGQPVTAEERTQFRLPGGADSPFGRGTARERAGV
jgi:uncharacterized protein (DUF362 family)